MKTNKLLLCALSIALLTPAFAQVTEVEAAGTSFKDVPTSYYVHKEITELTNRGVINGFSDGTFKPTKQVNRAEFAAFVARSLNLPKAESNFKDVPKTAALYDGVSSAYKAGIIKGFSNGAFKPGIAVNRQDMAVMIDRAMQIKGNYKKTKALSYGDKSKVGAYAKTSVERLSFYNVLGAFSGSNFAPTTIGTRAETAKYIYNMLTVVEGGTIVDPTPPPASSSEIEAIKKKNPLTLTYAEIVNAYGPYMLHRRFDLFGNTKGIVEWDMWKEYLLYIADAKEYNYAIVKRPDVWLNEAKSTFLGNILSEVSGNYPNFEIISLNGKPFLTSELLVGHNQSIYNDMNNVNGEILPTPPKMSGQFKIDLHYKKNDFAVYMRDSVGISKQTILPYTKENKSLMVDVKSAFSKTPQVKVSTNSISYNGKTLSFTNGTTQVKIDGVSNTLSVSPEMKNGVQMLPIREIASLIGLQTRVTSYKVLRIEILNYTETPSIGYK